MRVLDIDLDFFLADCCPLAKPGERPVLEGHEPWEKDRVKEFLESNCGLSPFAPLPGAVFETHDGALKFWQELTNKGSLSAPFHVTHVDAHSDLGIGRPGPGFVLSSVLCRPPARRAVLSDYYALEQLDEANYLLFALAFRWISALDNVRNPKSRPDIPGELLLPGRSDALRLGSFASRLLEGVNGPEPTVPFNVYDDYTLFKATEKYDFVSVAVSPRYAPKEADKLLDTITEYMII